MNPHLQSIFNFIQQDERLSAEQKNAMSKSLKEADKELEIAIFKLDRTEKVKRTTAILLEETIGELEHKRKAVEAQNRELGIESSLERVRTIAMGMRKLDDMLVVCQTIAKQLELLDVKEIRNVQTAIIYESKGTYRNYEYYARHDRLLSTEVDFQNHPLQKKFAYQMLQGAEEMFAENINGRELQDWFAYQQTTNQFVDAYLEQADSLHYYWFSLGTVALGMSTYAPLNKEEINLFKRFRNVFELAYRRFLDIEKAIAQAKEAQVEVALERVRSRTLAMQKSEELAETAAVLFTQLISLGIEPNRLYIGIVQEDKDLIEFWATDEDGSKVNNQFSGNINRNASIRKMYDAWKANSRSLTIDMQGEELQDYFHYLSEELNVPFKKGLSQKRRIQSIAFFGSGFLGIASPDTQPDETIILLERFAAVFNLTFTRFNDLKMAEAHAIQAGEDLVKLQAEKKRAEDALSELRATQTQLIQSEKMASLGELTAGIAHEIQNPLNFVNNFSELSNELVDEMMEEVAKGNFEEVNALAADIKQNLEKINHHGKRADGIVKGMLQHSRTSSGQKEPTDINALAEEYSRLSFHGLRSKDKSFNAILKTDFDKTIESIHIIPQDIGRVILNLITNAFYAVDEKKKSGINNFEPTVSVSTKKTPGKVTIRVADNGNGIPAKILEKIFQPFFTTKPTGQGTGLGLSLSYDIVKAHSGELEVQTEEGEGTAFIIQLPNV